MFRSSPSNFVFVDPVLALYCTSYDKSSIFSSGFTRIFKRADAVNSFGTPRKRRKQTCLLVVPQPSHARVGSCLALAVRPLAFNHRDSDTDVPFPNQAVTVSCKRRFRPSILPSEVSRGLRSRFFTLTKLPSRFGDKSPKILSSTNRGRQDHACLHP